MNTFSTNCLAGGTYLVTGASSGIGSAAARLIAQCGGRVIAAGRDQARLEETLSGLPPGTDHIVSVEDLADADHTADWIKALVGQHGALSGVFHAAGVGPIRPARMLKQAHLDELFGSSLYAAFGIARAASQRETLVDGASLVFMSSVSGARGQAGMTAYSAAKAGIDGMVRSLACELSARSIRVNAIAAGGVKTPMHDKLTRNIGGEATASYESKHLLGFGEADDVASAAVFLFSPAGRWISGSTLAVDGGFLVR